LIVRDRLEGALRHVMLAALDGAQRYPLLRSTARAIIPPTVRAMIPIYSTPSYDIWRTAFEQLLSTARPVSNDTSGRLVTCCGGLYPGGAERQLVNTVCGLARHGLRERLIVLADHLRPNHRERYDFYLPLLQAAGIEVREVFRTRVNTSGWSGSIQEPSSLIRQIRRFPLITDIMQLYREFIEIKPAVVHGWLDWSNVRAGLAAVLAGVPNVILSGRNLNPGNFFFDAPYFLPAYQALAQQPQVTLINNSEAGAQDYAQWMGVPRRRLRVVRNGVDFGEIDRPSPDAVAALRASLGASAGEPLVGGLFRFSPEKRPELWIETAALIAAARTDCRFALFGMGPLRNEMVALATKRGLADRLAIRDVTLEPLVALAAFDACLLTSGAEGTPNVALEAQWLGTPVIATVGGGTSEALDIGASGWLVEEADADALAKVVLQVLSDPNTKAIAAARGPAFVKRRFSMDRMLRETLDLYRIKTERPPGQLREQLAVPGERSPGHPGCKMQFSIITATLNSEAFLEQCIQSVLNQKFAHVEHIIVDGGSTDATLSIARRYPHLTILERPGTGIYDAWNIGLAQATGSVIGICNSDDFYAPNTFHCVHRAMNADGRYWMISGKAIEFDENPFREYFDKCQDVFSFEGIDLFGPAINARFFKRELFAKYGPFDTGFRTSSDCAYLMKIALDRPPAKFIDEVFYYYRSHGKSTTLSGSISGLEKTLREKSEIGHEFLAGRLLSRGEARHLRKALTVQFLSPLYEHFRAGRYLRGIALARELRALGPLEAANVTARAYADVFGRLVRRVIRKGREILKL